MLDTGAENLITSQERTGLAAHRIGMELPTSGEFQSQGEATDKKYREGVHGDKIDRLLTESFQTANANKRKL
jgi:hypothetical protein